MSKEESWNKLYKLMDEENFYISDFLACICANLLKYKDREVKTEIAVQGQIFEISFKKK